MEFAESNNKKWIYPNDVFVRRQFPLEQKGVREAAIIAVTINEVDGSH